MDIFLLHSLHKIYLQNKKPSIYLDIVARTKNYFIDLGFKEFFDKCLRFSEVSLWTSYQQNNVNELFPFLF